MTESVQFKMSPELQIARQKVASWLIALVLLVFMVVLWGGFVRLTGSGLSIPDWPLINGTLLPPMSDQDWQVVYRSYHSELYGVSSLSMPEEIPTGRFKFMFAIEYFHRSLAAIVGIVFAITLVKIIRRKDTWRQIKWLLLGAGILLVGQAVLGGVVVKQELQAELVAIHLGIAFIFLGILLWTALYLSRSPEGIKIIGGNNLALWSWLAVTVLWMQVVFGGLTAGTKAGVIFNTFPKIGDYLIPPVKILFSRIYGGFYDNLVQNQVLIQFIHRWWALLALVFIVVVIVKGMNAALSPRGRIALRLVGTVTVFQILWGILNLLLKAPTWVSLVHLGTALLIFALLVIIAHESRYEYAVTAL